MIVFKPESTLINNFVVDEDYKILLFRTEKQVYGGHNKEDILLNVDEDYKIALLRREQRKDDEKVGP